MRTALALLTVVPVGSSRLPAVGRGTLLAFPLVGLLVGLVWFAAAGAGLALWGPLTAALLVVAADAIVTGGLHLDGVADVGDVAGSRRRGGAALEVARDPNVGALGVLALVLVVLLRGALLVELLTVGWPWPLLAVPMMGRVAMLHAVLRSPPGQSSSVTPLATAATTPLTVVAALPALAVLAVAGRDPLGAVAALLLVALTVQAATAAWRCRVGAPSGDLVGACGVAAELLVLAVLTAG
jgi:adenosylcobinamide-GDP ribazoletransferase